MRGGRSRDRFGQTRASMRRFPGSVKIVYIFHYYLYKKIVITIVIDAFIMTYKICKEGKMIKELIEL